MSHSHLYDKKILAIDFDGTIIIHEYPHATTFKRNAKEVIKRLHTEGHPIVINTCRFGIHADVAKKFLLDNDIPFHSFNEHVPGLTEIYGNDTRKIYGDIYIDDKNLGGIPNDWEEIYLQIKAHT